MDGKNGIRKGLALGLVVGIAAIFIYWGIILAWPYAYNTIYGEKDARNLLAEIVPAHANAYQTAEAISNWQRENMRIPYGGEYERVVFVPWTNLTGKWRPFVRNGPPAWYLHTRTGNCKEIAESFAYLMHLEGHKVSIAKVPAEDHEFPEFEFNGTTYAVESWMGVVPNKTLRGNGTNWSIIISTDPYNKSDSRDISDEYLRRGQLQVTVLENGNTAENVYVLLWSRQLTRVDPKMYPEPRPVIGNKTNKAGNTQFKVGEKDYLIEFRKQYWIFDIARETNISIIANETTKLNVDLDNLEWKFKPSASLG